MDIVEMVQRMVDEAAEKERAKKAGAKAVKLEANEQKPSTGTSKDE